MISVNQVLAIYFLTLIIKDLGELKGKILGCWCRPNKCHGDILVELANGLTEIVKGKSNGQGT